jgi:outer membrane murein-binding lipoprotein Lpp
VNCNRLTSEDYISYALGAQDEPESAQLRSHLLAHCPTCLAEVSEAYEFWYIFAALTERTQGHDFPEPSAQLRDRVINVVRPRSRRRFSPPPMRTWMRIAAGVLFVAGAAGAWQIGRLQIQKTEARLTQEKDAVRKLESEKQALENRVAAARNSPAVFPGRDAIVSVQDPYVLRDLQRARQTEVAMSQALTEERGRAANLEKQLSTSNTLLASATREKEAADRQYRKAYEATVEKERGVHQLAGEITAYEAKVQDLESQVQRYHALIDVQKKGMEQHKQMISLLESRNVALVQLHGTEATQNGLGVALIAENSKLAFFPANLPVLPSGRTYQLWLIRDRAPGVVSAGAFTGDATLQFANQELLSGVKTLAVTDEPAGGSAAPTGHKVLVGNPRN